MDHQPQPLVVSRGSTTIRGVPRGTSPKGRAGWPFLLYDAFTFRDELDILEIRLHELDAVVDRFVLVEATKTFSGVHRELVWDKAQEEKRFAAFRDRMTYVPCRNLPYASNPWDTEKLQRNLIRLGLGLADPSDVVMISDVDEIPSEAAVRRAVRLPMPGVFEQDLFYYWLNCRRPDPWVHGTKIVPIGQLIGPQHLREYPGCFHIRDGGWHFSYMGGVARILEKLRDFSHQEYNEPRFRNEEWIQEQMEAGKDLFGRPDQRWEFLEGVGHCPRYVREHPEKFQGMVRHFLGMGVEGETSKGKIVRLHEGH